MLRPSMSQILKPGESYYEFVVAVARKAREIASDAEEEHFCLEEKPVTMAVQMRVSNSSLAASNSSSRPLVDLVRIPCWMAFNRFWMAISASRNCCS